MFSDGVSRPQQYSYIKWANSFGVLCKVTPKFEFLKYREMTSKYSYNAQQSCYIQQLETTSKKSNDEHFHYSFYFGIHLIIT